MIDVFNMADSHKCKSNLRNAVGCDPKLTGYISRMSKNIATLIAVEIMSQ